jgi:hypothetical protein
MATYAGKAYMIGYTASVSTIGALVYVFGWKAIPALVLALGVSLVTWGF